MNHDVLVSGWPQPKGYSNGRVCSGRVLHTGGQIGWVLDAASGAVKWTSRTYRGHLTLAGDTLVLLSESAGLVRLIAADPSGYRELAKVQVLRPGARTSTPPSLAGGRIFVRNLDELAAIEVGTP